MGTERSNAKLPARHTSCPTCVFRSVPDVPRGTPEHRGTHTWDMPNSCVAEAFFGLFLLICTTYTAHQLWQGEGGSGGSGGSADEVPHTAPTQTADGDEDIDNATAGGLFTRLGRHAGAEARRGTRVCTWARRGVWGTDR